MQDQLPIIFTFNAKYARPAYVVMQSIIDTAPPEQTHHFYVLHEGLSNVIMELGRLLFNTKNSSIVFLDISQEMKAIRISKHTAWHRSTFYRLLIPRLFREFNQALYLDSDVVVIKNIYEITSQVSPESALGVIRDSSFNPYPEEMRVGFTDNIAYFNSGVLFFRPSKIPEDQALWCLKLAARPHNFPDQDILNLVFHDHLSFLPDRWNFLTGYGEDQNDGRGDTEEDKKILLERKKERPHVHVFHFICQKPWQVKHVQNADLFRKYDQALSMRAKNFQTIFQRLLPF